MPHSSSSADTKKPKPMKTKQPVKTPKTQKPKLKRKTRKEPLSSGPSKAMVGKWVRRAGVTFDISADFREVVQELTKDFTTRVVEVACIYMNHRSGAVTLNVTDVMLALRHLNCPVWGYPDSPSLDFGATTSSSSKKEKGDAEDTVTSSE